MFRKLSFVLVFALSAMLVAAVPASAQDQVEESGLQALDLADVLGWKSIGGATVSKDGAWFGHAVTPAEGDAEVIIRETNGDRELKFPIGDPGRARVSFSDDSRWAAFTIFPTKKEAKDAEQSRERLDNKTGLVELATGELVEFEKIRNFAFSGENAAWLALHKGAARPGGAPGRGGGRGQAPPTGQSEDEGNAALTGSDMILYELATGQMLNIGNVREFAFNESGEWLSWVIGAEDQIGNGVQVRNMETGVVMALDSDRANYQGLNWTEAGDALALLKGKESEDYEDDLYSLVAFSNFSATGAERVIYDPAEDVDFPEGMTISDNRAPAWMDDLGGILFGITEVVEKEDAEDEGEDDEESSESAPESEGPRRGGRGGRDREAEPETSDLVVWHYLDERLQSQQQVQENRDLNFSFLSIYRVAETKFIRLADDQVRTVSADPNDRYAIGFDVRDYELLGNLDGRRYRDVYVTDLETGERTLAAERMRWFFGENPKSDHFLYYKGGDYYTYDMAAGEDRNITEGVGTSFINTEDDHNIVDPPIRPIGWAEDGQSVLLSDNWDVWSVPVHGGAGTNLTINGRADGIRYNRVFRLDPDDEGFDLSEPVYFNAYGERTKKSGFARLDPGQTAAELLMWEDASFGNLTKAEDADTYVYTRQTNTNFPDYYVAGGTLSNASRLSDANPQQADVRWSDGSILIDYVSDKGARLQGALHLPANYEEGKSYPTIVFIYEKRSQNLNRYAQPVAYSFNKSVYTSKGYAVLEPDITYTLNDPGMSAVWCVLPALDAAIATGVVDPERVGLHGHSWGGYQTSFIITQTNRFRAAAAGAPLTNMISMYSSIYWNTGGANQAIFESSQGRFQGGYWDNIEAYTRNSPVYYATRVTTPLLLLHNDQDGAVDWNQGIEYFNTLRRLNKEVVMLQYEGENHGLRKDANRKDYFVRMQEFFDHHLLDAEAPKWLKEGIDHLDLEDHRQERAKQLTTSGSNN